MKSIISTHYLIGKLLIYGHITENTTKIIIIIDIPINPPNKTLRFSNSIHPPFYSASQFISKSKTV